MSRLFYYGIVLLIYFIYPLNTSAVVGDTLTLEKELVGREDIVFFGGFEENFNDNLWRSRWGIRWTNRESTFEIVENGLNGGKSFRVNYPEGGLGPTETGAQFPMVFSDMDRIDQGLYQELYLRYYLKFEEGFDFNKGGKLPGLMGGGNSWVRSGGNQPNGTNGWTLRFMWRKGGNLVVYAYVPKSGNSKWGEDVWGQDISCNFTTQPGKWHCIEQYVNVGTPGKDNGKLKVWIDGIEKVDIDDMRFWDVENDFGKIGGIYFSTFHGGNSRDWAPQNDSYIQFDGMVVAKNRVGVLKE